MTSPARPARSFRTDLRWPLLVLALGSAGTLLAFALDRTEAREYALTVGAPSLWLLAAGAVWTGVVLLLRRFGSGRSPAERV